MTDHDENASLAATALAQPRVSEARGPSTSGTQPATSPAAGAQAQGPVGKTIKARYKIKRLLGEGGMGGVYEGEHLEIGKRVAIKLVHSLHARDGHIAARIKQEARSTSAIESEHIVQVFDAGEDEELGLFLVMELLKGEDLGGILARRKRVSQVTAAMLVAQAATGLARAHAAGIVHRDLKPANIFVVTRDDGSSLVKLVDFGIAKLIRDARAQEQSSAQPGLTRMGMVIGTPQYMSPEQAQGLPTVDHRTDVYSLGAVLFEAIVGESPFKEMPTYEQTILQIMTRPAPRISSIVPDVHPELDRLCAEMMAMDPSHRPQEMTVVRERLFRIFPQLENARMPMKSLTGDIALDATAFASGAISGEVQRRIEQAISATGPRAGTQSAMAVGTPGSVPPDAPAQRRRKGAIIAAASVFGLVGLIGGVALVKMSGNAEEKSPAGYGLVQSTVAATTAATATPTLPPRPSEPQIAENAGANAGSAATSHADAGAANAHPSTASPAHANANAKPAIPAHPSAKPVKGATPATPPPAESPPAARPVGGTGVSTEF